MAINKDGSFTNPFKSNSSSTTSGNPTDAFKNDPLVGSAVMGSSTSSRTKSKASEWLGNPDNINSLFTYATSALKFGTDVANTVRDQKALKDQVNKGTYQVGVYGSNNVGGGNEGGNQGGGNQKEEKKDDNKIGGMEKPVLFGLVGTAIILVGVGIFFATKGNGASSPPSATTTA